MKTDDPKLAHKEAPFLEIMEYIKKMRTELGAFEQQVSEVQAEASSLSAEIARSMQRMERGFGGLPTKAQLEAVLKLGEWQPTIGVLYNSVAFCAELLLGKVLQEPDDGDEGEFVNVAEASPKAKSFSILGIVEATTI